MSAPSQNVSTSLAKLFSGTFWNAFAVVGSRGLPLIQTMILVRLLTRDEFGAVSFIFAVYITLAPIADWGLAYSIQKFATERPDKDLVINTAFALRATLSLSLGGVCWLLDMLANTFHGYGYYIVLLLVSSSLSVAVPALHAQLAFRLASFLSFTMGLLALILTFFGLWFHMGIAAPISAQAVSFALIGCVALRLTLKRARLIVDGRSYDLCVQLLKFGLFTTLMSSLLAFTSQVGTITLTHVHGEEYAALYRIASVFASLPSIVGAVVLLPAMPLVSRLNVSGTEEDIAHFVRMVSRYLTILGIPVLLGGVVLAEPLIIVGAGGEYAESVAAFRWLMLGNVTLMLFTALSSVPLMTHGVKMLTTIAAMNAACALLITVALINYWPISGSALAVAIANAISVGLLIFWLKQRTFVIFEWHRYKLYATSGFVMLAVLWPLHQWILSRYPVLPGLSLAVLCGALVYVVGLLSTGALTGPEITRLVTFVRR